ncbi:MAG: hypothetical protein ABSG30_13480 [Steroidobacteraceae bacterium]|jgi:hypothetical protein
MSAVLSWVAVLATISAQSQAAQPNPPPQVCVNGKCVVTGDPPPVTSSGPQGPIKWNPGHYMASYSKIYPGSTISTVQRELDDLNNQDAVLGFRMYITWGAMEPTQGKYDFSVIDAIRTRLETAYNKPKRLVVYLILYNPSALGTNDGGIVPLYIQQGQNYSASPVAGSYGWWGANSNGNSTGMYAPALYTQPVMDRLIALVQALGQHLDGDPYVEAVEFNEDATVAQCASNNGTNTDPSYSDAAWLTQLQRLLTATTAAFPHTNVIMDNSWFNRPASAVALQQWMLANRIAPGTSDSWGQSALSNYGLSVLSDGMQTYLGVDANAPTVDLRPKTRAMIAVEGPDIFGSYFGTKGGPWTPLDILNAANQTYFASHVFWTHLFGTEYFRGSPVPLAAKWPNLAATLSANPLTHTAYPANYPQ